MSTPLDIRPDGSVVLELGPHCIQTAAREVHRQLTDALLAADDDQTAWCEALVLLGEFLQQEDFPALRAAHPELAGGQQRRVRIFRKDGHVRWEMVA